MRIVVNDIAASYGGAMSVLKQFYNYIKENDKQNEWIFILSGNYLEETERIKIVINTDVKKSGLHKLWFDFISGRNFINKLHPDLVLSLQNIITFGVKVPQIVYIHQSIPFQNEKKFSFFKSNERSVAIIQYLIGSIIKLSAKKADKIIVQTNWMKEAVLKAIGQNDKNCLVALPDIEICNTLPELNLVKGQFFYPTSNVIYKNNNLLIETCDILESLGFNSFKIKLTLPQQTILHKNIDCIGRLNTAQMFDMYSTSVLVFPSYFETVGLPLLEAKKVGTLIFAADCRYSREILSDYENAYFFDYREPSQLAKLMSDCLSGKIELKNTDIYINKDATSWNKVIDFLK